MAYARRQHALAPLLLLFLRGSVLTPPLILNEKLTIIISAIQTHSEHIATHSFLFILPVTRRKFSRRAVYARVSFRRKDNMSIRHPETTAQIAQKKRTGYRGHSKSNRF